MRPSVVNRREFSATVDAVQSLDTDLPERINDDAERAVPREWAAELGRRASTRQEQRLLADTADTTISEQTIRLQSANRGRALSGGLTPAAGWGPVEHGSTARQFRPRNRNGYVVGPALKAILPRIADIWQKTGERIIGNAFEGKRE